MARRKKPVTKSVIKKYFGKNARIRTRWFEGGYKVRTLTGEALISDDEVKVVLGGDDMYRAGTLLMGELWGSFTAYGDRETIMAWMAHAEACGINARPGIKRGWFWRTVIFTAFVYGLMGASNNETSGIIIAAAAAFAWWLAASSYKQRVRQLAAEVGYRFPRVHGTMGAASDEDLEREGWL